MVKMRVPFVKSHEFNSPPPHFLTPIVHNLVKDSFKIGSNPRAKALNRWYNCFATEPHYYIASIIEHLNDILTYNKPHFQIPPKTPKNSRPGLLLWIVCLPLHVRVSGRTCRGVLEFVSHPLINSSNTSI